MPRRKRPYYKSGTILFNGQTHAEATASPISIEDVMRPVGRHGHNRSLHGDVADVVDKYDELAFIDKEALIRDICNEVAFAKTLRLDLLTRGKNSKPHAWTVQVLFCCISTVMERHGVNPTIYDPDYDTKPSLYIRLSVEIARIAGLQVSAHPKDVAVAARRLEHSVVAAEVLQKQDLDARSSARIKHWRKL